MSTRGVYEYLEYVGNSLISDVDIAAFCTTNFRRTLKVFIGQDESQLPSDELCPMIIMTSGGRGTTGNDHLKTRSARLTLAIADDITKVAKASTTNGPVKFPGLALLDEFADLTAKALVNLAAHSSGYYVSEIGDGPEDAINFPVYKAFLGLQITLDSSY